MKKNTFYKWNDETTSYWKYFRVDDIIDDCMFYTKFTENFVEGERNYYSSPYDLESRVTELPKSWDTICVGDKIINNDGDIKTILETSSYLIAVSGYNNTGVIDGWWTKASLKKCGWAIVDVKSEKDENTIFDNNVVVKLETKYWKEQFVISFDELDNIGNPSWLWEKVGKEIQALILKERFVR